MYDDPEHYFIKFDIKYFLNVLLCLSFSARDEKQRAAAIDAEEKADEDFVQSIFAKNGDVKVRRDAYKVGRPSETKT